MRGGCRGKEMRIMRRTAQTNAKKTQERQKAKEIAMRKRKWPITWRLLGPRYLRAPRALPASYSCTSPPSLLLPTGVFPEAVSAFREADKVEVAYASFLKNASTCSTAILPACHHRSRPIITI